MTRKGKIHHGCYRPQTVSRSSEARLLDPDEGRWVFVVSFDIALLERLFDVSDTGEHASPHSLFSQVTEEPLYHVEPRCGE